MPDKHSQMKGGGGGGRKKSPPEKRVWQGTSRAHDTPTMTEAEREDYQKEKRRFVRLPRPDPRRWKVPDRDKK